MLKRQLILLIVLLLVASAYFLSPYRLDWESLSQFHDWIRPWNTVRMELEETRLSLRQDIDRLHSQVSVANQQIASLNQQIAVLQTESQQLIAFHDQETQDLNRSHQQTIDQLKNAQLSINEQLEALRQQMEQAQGSFVNTDQLNDTLTAAFATAAKYHPVNLDLGSLPVGEAEHLTYPIPAPIPDTAREILVYVYIATNYVKGDVHDFKIFVTLDTKEANAFYLHAVAFAQQGWSYNSENAWLPMPTDRTLRIQSDGKPLFGSWNSQVRIIAYR